MAKHSQSATAITGQPGGWSVRTALTLGRVSNLPTLWSNVLAATVLSGSLPAPNVLGLLLIAMSLAYMGGMYLNDAFDRHIDARERPERPIPAGLVSARSVFVAGGGMLLISIVLAGVAGYARSHTVAAVLAAVLLSACIVLYNAWHKGNPISPLLMGLCRVMAYVTCALAVSGTLSPWLIIAALSVLAYLIGLTYTAKQENFGRVTNLWPLLFLTAPAIVGAYHSLQHPALWLLTGVFCVWTLYCTRLILRRNPGDIPRAVVQLIAGICLIDGLMIVTAATSVSTFLYAVIALPLSLVLYGVCIAAFLLTLVLQRFVSGT